MFFQFNKSVFFLFIFFVSIKFITLPNVFPPQVKVTKDGTVSEYGMLATDDIEEGEVLFTIPRAALLHQGTSEVSDLLDKGDDHLTG